MEESHMHKRIAVTAAVDVIAGNVDLLSEILLRLPARSLIRFSVVCKLWSLLINNIQFRLSHCHAFALSSPVPPSGIYFYNCLTNIEKVESLALTDDVTSLPPLPVFDIMYDSVAEILNNRTETVGVTITQSCNGLLMCEFTLEYEVPVKLGYVLNPTKSEYHPLPYPCNNRDDHYHFEVVCGYFLMFDPSEPPYYKALCVKMFGATDAEVYAYAPGSKTWRSCCRFSTPPCMYFDNGVFWNGGILWIGEYYSVYFDAHSEEVVTKRMPPRPQGNRCQKIRYFGEWGGHLHLIQVQSLHAKKFNVLELDKDTLKWSVKYRVHLARLISAFPEMVQQTSSGTQYAFSILSVIRGEKEEDSVLLLTIPGKVVAYNLVHKTVKVVRELPGEVGDTFCLDYVNAYPFTETLFPLCEWTSDEK